VRHSELEQSETKAQAALVTILSLTQITELKLLLDIGRQGHRFYDSMTSSGTPWRHGDLRDVISVSVTSRQGHRFYDFVLTLLVACISLEICVGVIIIYIGNLHYYQVDSILVVHLHIGARSLPQYSQFWGEGWRQGKKLGGTVVYFTIADLWSWTKPTDLCYWPARRGLWNYIHHRHLLLLSPKAHHFTVRHRGEGWVDRHDITYRM